MEKKAVSGIMLTLLLIGMLTLAFNIQLVKAEIKTWTADDSKASSPQDKSSAYSDLNTVDRLEHNSADATSYSTNLLAFYYPWYGTPNVSGYWFHWNDERHNPNNFLDGRRDIAAKHYPLLDVYDSNNESLIRKHIEIAKMANIEGFVVSWWGIGSFEDNALSHIKNVCEQTNFKFTIYYEAASSLDRTLDDITYLLDNYANSRSWYRVDNRPVIYVYGRALDQLSPQMYWDIYGNAAFWTLFEDVRKPCRNGIFVVHPYRDSIGYVESNMIALPPDETYSLKLAISNVRNDCSPYSDVGFKIKIRNQTEDFETLDNLVVNFNDGWLDLSYDISSYAGQTVEVRVESYDGGLAKWCSEWAAVDYLFIMDSKGQILNPEPYFDNGWKTVVKTLTESGYNPYFIMDFGGYEYKVKDFAEYFLNFTDGIHTYAPIAFSMSEISEVYNEASNAAHSLGKIFVATVMPGCDDTEVRSPGHIIDRQNGSYYKSFWSTAKSSSPDHYIITSFNEWHEGTEIEPSLECGYQYVDLTKIMSTMWTVDDDGPADSYTIQGAINAANPGDTIYVYSGTYHENVVVNKTVVLIGEKLETTIVDGGGTRATICIVAGNVLVKHFTFRTAYGPPPVCIISGVGSIVEENLITGGFHGIFLSTNNSIVSNNVLTRITDYGVLLTHSYNNTVCNNNVTRTWYGIGLLMGSSNNVITSNIISRTAESPIPIHGFEPSGILLYYGSENNTIIGNMLSENGWNGIAIVRSCKNNFFSNNTVSSSGYFGIWIEDDSNDNTFYHNNFINNRQFYVANASNIWDDGYPSGGNCWSDYTDVDHYSGPYQNETGSDGIGDTPYIIDENNQDNYPLTGMFYDFEVLAGYDGQYHIEVVSNSTVSDLMILVWLSSPTKYLQPGQQFISFFVAGLENTTGFCRVTIPRNVLNGTYTVLVDGEEVPANELTASNTTHAYLYFTYKHTKNEVIIIPEFPSSIILTLFMVFTMLTMVFVKRKFPRKSKI